jgi:uncharacterized protein
MDYATGTTARPNFARLSHWRDNLMNFVTALGTSRDPTTSSTYNYVDLDRFTLENAYRSDWIARRVIDSPADDATREWRHWNASQNQIEALEAAENDLQLRKKVKQWIIRARLYGGAALVIGIDDGHESWEPLDLDNIGKDSLQFVVVMNRYELNAGPRIYNVSSRWYTRPEYYTVATPLFGFSGELGEAWPGTSFSPLMAPQREQGQAPPQSNVVRLSRGPAGGFGGDPYKQVTPVSGMVRLHPSRVIELAGNELPDWRLAPMGGGWGDSVLQTVDESLKDWGLTVGAMANMVNDAKTDIIKVKDFAQKITTNEYQTRLLNRWALANISKSTVNALVLDKEEEWQRIQTNFGGLAELLREYMVVISGATNIPISRLFGQSSGRGLGAGSSGGEQDLKNYYDSVASWQRNTVTPVMEWLDQALIRSTLGGAKPGVYYEWAPLWQMSDTEKAEMALKKAQAYQIDVQMGQINEDALRHARISQLIEDGTYPGLDDAIDQYGEEPDVPEARLYSPGVDPVTGLPTAPGGAPKPPGGGGFGGGGPQPLPPAPSGAAAQPSKGAAVSRGTQPAKDGFNPVHDTNFFTDPDGIVHPIAATEGPKSQETGETQRYHLGQADEGPAGRGRAALAQSLPRGGRDPQEGAAAMIEKQIIEGRPALVAYMDDKFNPVHRGKETLVKVVFTDPQGGSLFLTPSASARPSAKDSFRATRVADDNPNHDPHTGQFASGEGGGAADRQEKSERFWENPAIAGRALRRMKFDKLGEKIDQASSGLDETNDAIKDARDEIGAITPEERAGLKPGEEFTAESDLAEHQSTAMEHTLALRNKVAEGVNLAADALGLERVAAEHEYEPDTLSDDDYKGIVDATTTQHSYGAPDERGHRPIVGTDWGLDQTADSIHGKVSDMLDDMKEYGEDDDVIGDHVNGLRSEMAEFHSKGSAAVRKIDAALKGAWQKENPGVADAAEGGGFSHATKSGDVLTGGTRTALVHKMLRHPEGATRKQVKVATGWSRVSLHEIARRGRMHVLRSHANGEVVYKGVPGPAPMRTAGQHVATLAGDIVEGVGDANPNHDPKTGQFSSGGEASGRATIGGKSIHAVSAAEAEPILNKVFHDPDTGAHATIVGAGFNKTPHPEAVNRLLGVLPSGKEVYGGPSRREVNVKWVETPEQARGKGGGHAVMAQVEKHLDKYGLPARLNTNADLHPFYAKHGFVPAAGNQFEMVREPRARHEDQAVPVDDARLADDNPNHDPKTGEFSSGGGDPVAHHTEALQSNMLNNEEFDQAIRNLGSDKNVSGEHLRKIVENVLGYVPGKARTRKALVQALVNRQVMESRGHARGQSLGKSWGAGSDDAEGVKSR